MLAVDPRNYVRLLLQHMRGSGEPAARSSHGTDSGSVGHSPDRDDAEHGRRS
jgi:hypothetical protein